MKDRIHYNTFTDIDMLSVLIPKPELREDRRIYIQQGWGISEPYYTIIMEFELDNFKQFGTSPVFFKIDHIRKIGDKIRIESKKYKNLKMAKDICGQLTKACFEKDEL